MLRVLFAIGLIAVGFLFGAEIESALADYGLDFSIPIWQQEIIPGIWTLGFSIGPSMLMMIIGVVILLFFR